MKKTKAAQRPRFTNTRKVIRKEKRLEKKVHRKEHYLKKKPAQKEPSFTPGRFVKRPAEDPEPVIETKKKKKQNQPTSQEIIKKERQKEQKEVQRLNSQISKQRRKMLVQANEEEDRMIKKLEKQLGLNKAKNKNNYFADDGLDYLLEICDRATSEQIVAAEKHLADVEDESDFEEDLAAVTGKDINKKDKKKSKGDKKTKTNDKSTESEDEEGISDNGELSDEENEEQLDGEESDIGNDEGSEQGSVSGDDLSGSDIEEDDEGSEFGESDASEAPEEKPTKSKKSETKSKSKEKQNKPEKKSEPKPSKERVIKAEDLSKVFIEKKSNKKPDVWEDIYGRKRDKEGNVIKEEKGVYIPPHLRNKDSASDKELVQLKRQIKSVLNKLAGTNLHWACTSIENLYSCNSRHSVNSALLALWTDATIMPSSTPDRLLAEHAALIAVLHANVGNEVGAHFLQELTKRFDEMMQTPQPVGDKQLDNLVCCLAHLYSFKIYHANLVYDILSRLMETLSEKNIECVLVALRTVGGVLRKEEPLALKNFIHETQQRVQGMNENATDGSRIKFLLEVLMAVKNNNLTKIPNYDPTYSEHLKKMIRGIIRKGNYVTPLNIRLEDLLKADERGKWWVVGSAWEGNRVLEEKPAAKPLPSADQKLLELARKQRMNTDVRRSIFCVIMAAEDYMAAFEKLEQLNLRGPQQREIAHVVVACCLQEKNYNPYYGLSFQFTIWDKIKDLDGLQKHSLTNLAQFIVHLVMEKGLPLSVLKIIQFSDLTKRTVKFMRQILLAIIMNADLQATLEVFHRIAKSPKLHMFRESLRLFIQHFLVKNAEKKTTVLSEAEMTVLKERAAEIEKILTMHENKMMF
ncbi:MIF4G domain-containing protein [Phthorimaea operculella]|nr:MIF4G domain-containing protein [Phthorimaea operculella]